MKRLRFPAAGSIVSLCGQWLCDNFSDFSNISIITPTKIFAEALKKKLSQLHGGVFIAPIFHAIDDLGEIKSIIDAKYNIGYRAELAKIYGDMASSQLQLNKVNSSGGNPKLWSRMMLEQISKEIYCEEPHQTTILISQSEPNEDVLKLLNEEDFLITTDANSDLPAIVQIIESSNDFMIAAEIASRAKELILVSSEIKASLVAHQLAKRGIQFSNYFSPKLSETRIFSLIMAISNYARTEHSKRLNLNCILEELLPFASDEYIAILGDEKKRINRSHFVDLDSEITQILDKITIATLQNILATALDLLMLVGFHGEIYGLDQIKLAIRELELCGKKDTTENLEFILDGVKIKNSYKKDVKIKILPPSIAYLMDYDQLIIWVDHFFEKDIEMQNMLQSGKAIFCHKGSDIALPSILLAMELDKKITIFLEQLSIPATNFIKYEQIEARPPLSLRPTRISFTDCELLIRNPFGFFAKNILKLKRNDELGRNWEESDNKSNKFFGSASHKLIETCLKNKKITLTDIKQLGHKIFVEYFGTDPLSDPHWQSYISSAYQAILLHHDFINSGGIVYSEFPLEAQIGNFTFYGRADAILIHGKNARIIDYKTGNVPSNKDVGDGLSPQLVLEAMVLEKMRPDLKVDSLEYWKLHSNALEEIAITTPIKTREKMLVSFTYYNKMLDELWQKFYQDDAVPYSFCPDPKKKPRYDDYKYLARRLDDSEG